MIYPTVYISVTDERSQLVIDGSLALLQDFLATLNSKGIKPEVAQDHQATKTTPTTQDERRTPNDR